MGTRRPETYYSQQNFGSLLHQVSPNTRRLVRNIEQTNNKIINCEVAISFNLVCLKEDILPGYTNLKLHHENARLRQSTQRFRRELVEEEVEEKRRTASNLQQELFTLNEKWSSESVPDHIRTSINEHLLSLKDQHRRATESRNIKKTIQIIWW